MKNFNLNLLILILVILVVIMQLRSCLTKERMPQTSVIIQSSAAVQSLGQGQGLDLDALGLLLGRAQNAQELERLLNQEGGINNLDLNNDGVVDFIAVTEFGSGNERGFSLSTETDQGVETEIATIRVQQDSEQNAQVQIHGNERIYGANTYYHSRIGLGEVLLFAWLFSPHPPYYSPFAWGYYPAYYGGGYRSVSRTQYQARTSAARNRAGPNATSFQKSNRPQFQPKSTSPKAGAAGASSTTARRSSLSNPARSQRSFSSVRRSAGLRSGSRFGGGK